MPNWKKVIISGSDAELNTVTASNGINALNSGFTVETTTGTTELEVQGNITASGHLFASLSFDNTPVTDGVVVYDTANGQLYYTGSYGGVSSGGGLQFETVSAVPNGGGAVSPAITDTTLEFSGSGGVTTTVNLGNNIVTVGIDGSNINDDDWFIVGNPYDTGNSFISSSRVTVIGPVGSVDEINGVPHAFSVRHSSEPNTFSGAAEAASALGRGLEAINKAETVVGKFNNKDIPDKLFSVGNGNDSSNRQNIAVFRSRSIDFSPDGRILNDYMSGSAFELFPEIDVVVEILGNSPSAGGTFSSTISEGSQTSNILFTGVAPVGQNPEESPDSGISTLEDEITSRRNALGLDTLPLSLIKVRMGGLDLDNNANNERIFDLTIGTQPIIDLAGGTTSADPIFVGTIASNMKTIWSASLSNFSSTYGGTDIPGDFDGIVDGTTVGTGASSYDLGAGDVTNLSATAVGIDFSFNVDSGVAPNIGNLDANDLLSNSDPANTQFVMQFTFRLPAVYNHPMGAGFYIGRETDRALNDSSFTPLSDLGNRDHAAVLANIGSPSTNSNYSGLRVILGNTEEGTDQTSQTANNFISFDRLDYDGNSGLENSMSRIGLIRPDSTGLEVVYSATSDKRLKENIKLSKKGLDIIKDIKVRDFNWKRNPNETVTGFIAQELHRVIPQAVGKGGKNANTEPWTVNQTKLIPYMVKAIQEQQKLIEKLQKEIDQLK